MLQTGILKHIGLRKSPIMGLGGSGLAASINADFINSPSLILPGITPLTLVRATTATFIGSNGLVQSAANNIARFAYNSSTLAALGLLSELAATNIAIQSGDLSNVAYSVGASIVVAPTVTGNIAVAPDGTTTAARIVYPQVIGAGAYSVVFKNFGVLSAVARAGSVYLRGNAGGETLYIMQTPDGTTFTKTTCVLTTAWQRFPLLYTGNVTANFFQIGVDLRDATQSTQAAQTVFATFAQDELGAVATSYIPTTTTSVTRNADVYSRTLGGEFNPNAGTLFVDFIQPVNDATTRAVIALDDGTANNLIFIFNNGATNFCQILVAGVVRFQSTLAAPAAGTRVKIALAFAVNDVAAYQNNAAMTIGTAGTTLPTVTTFRVGNYANVGQLGSTIAKASYYPGRLPNNIAQALTV